MTMTCNYGYLPSLVVLMKYNQVGHFELQFRCTWSIPQKIIFPRLLDTFRGHVGAKNERLQGAPPVLMISLSFSWKFKEMRMEGDEDFCDCYTIHVCENIPRVENHTMTLTVPLSAKQPKPSIGHMALYVGLVQNTMGEYMLLVKGLHKNPIGLA